jgi:hypothetical protein
MSRRKDMRDPRKDGATNAPTRSELMLPSWA